MTSTNVDRETGRDVDRDIVRDERIPAPERAYSRSFDDERRREVRTTAYKETRRAFVTTEFWLTLAAAAAVVIAGYWDEAHLAVNLAWALGIGLVATYVLSRGIAKAGSMTRQTRELS
jgi:hypothetical protein